MSEQIPFPFDVTAVPIRALMIDFGRNRLEGGCHIVGDHGEHFITASGGVVSSHWLAGGPPSPPGRKEDVRTVTEAARAEQSTNGHHLSAGLIREEAL